ncbi:MAG: flagella assembly protein FlgT middle domain-containing protein [Marinobacter sp.]|uniref:flagella assembly protein FlgT middle domain-containing protein n=1 Tax=Marinobacter sp. TaxID=50741 RepID=UPI0034A08B6C
MAITTQRTRPGQVPKCQALALGVLLTLSPWVAVAHVPVEESPRKAALIQATPQEAGPKTEAENRELEPVHLVITKEVGVTQNKLDKFATTIRREQQHPEFVPHTQCPNDNAPRYRKKIAVAGFTVESPQHGAWGSFHDAGENVAELLYQNFQRTDQVQPFLAQNWQMFASLDRAPTRLSQDNRLGKYSAVSREMGVQFVVSGVIRDLDVHDKNAWNTSTYSNVKRALFSADTSRAFVVDVVVHDGFTGQIVMEERFSTEGRWDVPRTEKVAFGGSRFLGTGYGQAVEQALGDITEEIVFKLACQPMLVPILQVDGKDILLDVGTDSGMLPGARMSVLRSESSLALADAPPQLWDTGVELHIHSLSLDTSRAWMPEYGGVINIQAGDYAVVY